MSLELAGLLALAAGGGFWLGAVAMCWVFKARFAKVRGQLAAICRDLKRLEDEPEQPRCSCAARRAAYERDCG